MGLKQACKSRAEAWGGGGLLATVEGGILYGNRFRQARLSPVTPLTLAGWRVNYRVMSKTEIGTHQFGNLGVRKISGVSNTRRFISDD